MGQTEPPIMIQEKEAEKMIELLSCLWSPPSKTPVKSSLCSARFIYCNAKSDMDILPSLPTPPLLLSS